MPITRAQASELHTEEPAPDGSNPTLHRQPRDPAARAPRPGFGETGGSRSAPVWAISKRAALTIGTRPRDRNVAKGLAENDRAESRKGSSYEGRAGRRRAHTPRTVPRSRRNPGSELEASLELADPVEEFAHEHGARVVEPEVPA